jgi:Cu/Ag efflux pump CusA
MTALGAIIALLPLAIGIGTGSELHQPLAIAVIGGFLIAMPLLLIVLPSLLYYFDIETKEWLTYRIAERFVFCLSTAHIDNILNLS